MCGGGGDETQRPPPTTTHLPLSHSQRQVLSVQCKVRVERVKKKSKSFGEYRADDISTWSGGRVLGAEAEAGETAERSCHAWGRALSLLGTMRGDDQQQNSPMLLSPVTIGGIRLPVMCVQPNERQKHRFPGKANERLSCPTCPSVVEEMTHGHKNGVG